MRKLLLMVLAAVTLAMAAPITASTAPAVQGEALKTAIDRVDTATQVWHGGRHYRYRYYPRRYYRYRYAYPRRYYRRYYYPRRYYAPRRYYRYYRW